MSARILVVDDDASIRETFHHHLTSMGHDVLAVADAPTALGEMAAFDPALLITDVRMPGMSGLELLEKVRSARPDADVIVITAHEDMATAIGAMKAGAYDYLVKPLDLDHIDLVVSRCLRDRRVRARARQLAEEAVTPWSIERLVGRHPRMIEIYKLVGSVADTMTPVLVRGETGTGKELIARAIHFSSKRSEEPFIALNCTALAENLLESELFGHVRGAFTGAVSERKGRFELAGRGTLFLDEIGDTSSAFQAKLLRVLQEREFHPVGSERVRRTDARVITATNRDVEQLVRGGKFREDLYYRLRVVEIQVPPLRERPDDLPLLVRHFAEKLAREMHLGEVTVSEPALKSLSLYDWPGNVRELENTLARAMLIARGGVIGPEHLSLGGARGPGEDDLDADDSLAAAERAQVRKVLQKTGGNKRQASRILGISRPTLDRMIATHGLEGEVVNSRDHNGQGS